MIERIIIIVFVFRKESIKEQFIPLAQRLP